MIERFHHDYKETIYSAKGNINENGDFSYQGAFAIRTIFKNNHFATKKEAAMDLIADIDSDIDAMQSRKQTILDKYCKETENA